MALYHIVAMSKNRVIGKDNKLPWHIPADLKHFKKRTTGSTVIMGRKTFESIGKPLPNRANFVLSRTQKGVKDQVHFYASLEEAMKNVVTKDVYIIGGAEIYKQTMDKIDGIYLTRIDADYEGDAFYPEVSPEKFEELSIEPLQENPKVDVVFYEKRPTIFEKKAQGNKPGELSE